MDYKKTNAPTTTVTRDLMELCKDTGNIYETVMVIAKRANQIAVEMNHSDAGMHDIGDFACGDQLAQLDRGRTESPARSIFAMQSIAV